MRPRLFRGKKFHSTIGKPAESRKAWAFKGCFFLDLIFLELAIALIAPPLEYYYFFESSPSKRRSTSSRLSRFFTLVSIIE